MDNNQSTEGENPRDPRTPRGNLSTAREAAIEIAKLCGATETKEHTDNIEKIVAEAIAKEGLKQEAPKYTLLELWNIHQQKNGLDDEQLDLIIAKMKEVNDFVEAVRTDRLFYIMNLNAFEGFKTAREERVKYKEFTNELSKKLNEAKADTASNTEVVYES